MKKIFALILVLVMTFSLVACSKEKVDFAAQIVEQVCSDPEWDASVEMLREQGIEMGLSSRGNDIVYTYTLLMELTEEDEAMVDMMMEGAKASVEPQLELFRQEVPQIEKLIFEFYDMDGELLGSFEAE